MGLAEICPVQLRPREPGALKLRTSELALAKQRPRQICIREAHITQVCSGKMCAT
jgi:hypothetical protein